MGISTKLEEKAYYYCLVVFVFVGFFVCFELVLVALGI
jgi:hypothetical protein